METLKQARERRGIKQYAVADAIGVSRQTYASYECDSSNMSILQAQKACAFIGCDITDIFFGNDLSLTKAEVE